MKLALIIDTGERSIGPVNENTHTVELAGNQIIVTSTRPLHEGGNVFQISTVFDPVVAKLDPGTVEDGPRSERAGLVLRQLVARHDRTLNDSVELIEQVGYAEYARRLEANQAQ